MPAEKPVIHGRDHRTGGADPVPGLLPMGVPGYFDVASAFSLKGYWSCQQTGELLTDGSGILDNVLNDEAAGASGALDYIQGPLGPSALHDAEYAQTGPGGELIRAIRLHALAHNVFDTSTGSRTGGSWGMNPGGTDSIGPVMSSEIINHHAFTWGAWVSMDSEQWKSAAPIWYSGRAAITIVPLDTPGVSIPPGSDTAHSSSWVVRFYRRAVSIGGETYIDSSPLPADTWLHLAVTYDGTTMKFYANGILVGSGAGSSGNLDMGSATSNEFALGWAPAQFGTWSMYLAGRLSGVTFFDEALPATGIAALYDAIINPDGFQDGQVLFVDADGNAYWDYPQTVTVDGV